MPFPARVHRHNLAAVGAMVRVEHVAQATHCGERIRIEQRRHVVDFIEADTMFDADTLAAMCRLRDVFDPDHRANRGKVVPVHSCREWHQSPAGRAS